MDTKKIAAGCFVGGVLFGVVALMCAPEYWWLGVLAGMASGYIGYEFREFLAAIPLAARTAWHESSQLWQLRHIPADAWYKITDEVREWLAKPHPFFYGAVIVTAAWSWIWVSWFIETITASGPQPSAIGWFIATWCMLCIFCCVIYVSMTPLLLFAYIGACREKQFWYPFLMPSRLKDDEGRQEVADYLARGFAQQPITYANVARWVAKGIGRTVLFFVWTIWKYLSIGLWFVLSYIALCVRNIVVLTYSHPRILCAVHGTLGGVMSYKVLYTPQMSVAAQIMFVVFGGILGVFFGLVAKEVISKRILGVPNTQ
jgi:hypothetical protein